MKTLISIGAHPDDASIFYGGTLAKHVADGWRVISVTVTDGRGSPHSFEMSGDDLVKLRHHELDWESRRLGVEMEHLQMPGVKTPETQAAAVDALVKILSDAPPDKVIIHHLEDAHPTHVLCARVALRALLAASEGEPGFPLPEVWQADGWEPVHYPDIRVDVTAFMNVKMAAISMHASQIYDTPYVMGAWGLCLYRAGFAASHEVTDPACVFAEAFRRLAPDQIRDALAAAEQEG